MKRFVITFIISIFALFIIVQTGAADDTPATDNPIGVSQLMNSADQYSDNITVQGIVSKVFPQDNLIGLIDKPGIKDCSKKTCKTPCPSAAARHCTKDASAACPMAAARADAAKCPMMSDKKCDKACTQKCDKATSKQCPGKAVNENGNKCPMAAPAKKCTRATEKDCTKPCPETAGKRCGKPGFTLTLPVQWEGKMPELSSEVRVAGKISHQNGRMVFVAESIKAMSN